MQKLPIPKQHLRWWMKSKQTPTFPFASSHSNSTQISHDLTLYDRILKFLQNPNSVSDLKRIHTLVIRNGLLSKSVLASMLIRSYALLSGISDARRLFDNLPKQTVYTYNYMIKAYVDLEHYELALAVYSQMLSVEAVPRNCITLSFIAKACICLRTILLGKIVHGHVLVTGFESDLHLATAFIDFYCKCEHIEDARKVFDGITKRDDFVWTAMICGYFRIGNYLEATSMFSEMRETALKGNIVTWNALLTGFVHGGLISDALGEFRRMQVDGVQPDKVSLVTILPAFSRFAILKLGFEVHAYVIRMGFELDLFVVSSLVDMYAKCGKLMLARCLFDRVKVKDIGLWNAMIVGYGIHGQSKEALQLFHQMQVLDMRPNVITFTSILSACSHAGMVNEGRQCFDSMVCDYGITPCHEHYACMVDMFGRAGRLKEAYEFIRSMPVEPTKDVWGAFLGACRNHRDWKLAEIAAQHIFGCKDIGMDAGYHVVMSNIYAETGRWSDVAKLRASIRDGGLKKRSGFSWIEVGDIVHTFYMADMSHPQSYQIYDLLKSFEEVEYRI
ncbi:putative pentatricopeptide repeat-containing protein At3g49142 [Magnolia sinica]|uniref:putative pentatricopeptide repeat-containing protein At3g49142 n=1 Tax=Magnolia sinica TaxID=86752 RepID=UPI002659F37B|nr:putative pentatricopeptide repeat-containing protein At3g49142 [Magnolia sinica]XP_058079696.1 putative pentatricopeptide repeat-containing protein At3g49142 [Magnolia sinica]